MGVGVKIGLKIEIGAFECGHVRENAGVFGTKNELWHHKTNKKTCVSSEDSVLPSLIKVITVRMKKLRSSDSY